MTRLWSTTTTKKSKRKTNRNKDKSKSNPTVLRKWIFPTFVGGCLVAANLKDADLQTKSNNSALMTRAMRTAVGVSEGEALAFDKPDIEPAHNLTLPAWFVEYAEWHKQQLIKINDNPNQWQDSAKYLIVRCPRYESQCGGTADRLKALPTVLRLGHLLNRVVFYNWERPHPLEEFLQPTPMGINWTYPSWLANQLQQWNSINEQFGNYTEFHCGTPEGVHLAQQTNQTVIYLQNLRRTLPDHTVEMLPNYYNADGGQRIYDLVLRKNKKDPSFVDVYHSIWHATFRPSPPIQRILREKSKKLDLTLNQYTGFHFRSKFVLDESTADDRIMNATHCAIHLATFHNHNKKQVPTILVATDSSRATQTVLDYVQHNLTATKARVVTTLDDNNPKEPFHLDRGANFLRKGPSTREDPPQDYYDTFVDLYLLSRAQCIVAGRGGFARWANWISQDPSCIFEYFAFGGRKYLFPKDHCPVPDEQQQSSTATIVQPASTAAPKDPRIAGLKWPPPGRENDPSYCQWGANDSHGNDNNNHHPCVSQLLPNFCGTGQDTLFGTRVLLLGDSTFGPNFLARFLRQRLRFPAVLHFCPHNAKSINCQWRQAERCNNEAFYGFVESEYSPNGWVVQPEYGREGPVEFGLSQHRCSDCAGCKTGFRACSPESNPNNMCPPQDATQQQQQHRYQGGYINIEFARDVILQTNHHNTSQENIALYLNREYNSPELVEAFGKPYCVVNTGHHDVLIDGITTKQFVQNVQWYLNLLKPECHRILWVSSTAPQTNKYAQKLQLTLDWNQAVRELLAEISTGDPNGKHQLIPFLDVFAASIEHEHRDNLHMSQDWYQSLANFIGDLVESCDDSRSISNTMASPT